VREVLKNLATHEQCRPYAEKAWKLMEALYPICRSITGEGVRDTLRILEEHIPLEITQIASGKQVFDWEVPDEWNVVSAWIRAPDGRRIADLHQHTLHLMSYSVPIRATMTLDDLRPHLHTLPEHPDWIPYRTSYYKKDWGFCIPHRLYESLPEGDYEVVIDSSLAPGHLTYAECVVRGSSAREFLIFTHICHPSLCNDNLTGIALAALLASELAGTMPELTYRFVFAPGTIGSICWLAANEREVGRIEHGLVMGLLGDRGPLTYKRSRQSAAGIDRIAEHVLSRISSGAQVIDFSPYGYDERQLCSPGFNLPVGRLTRSANSEYPQYHSSADDFSIIDKESLAESLFACASIVRVAEHNASYVNLNPKCEPRLGKRGLFRPTGGAHPGEYEHALLWVLNQSDGEKDLLEIARRSGMSFEAIMQAAEALVEVGLLKRQFGVRGE
jgi:aminopeptidase-like protein